MTKTWEQLTQSEKIEELRNDIVKTMEAVNHLTRRVDAAGSAFDDLYAKIKAVEGQLSAK